MIQTSSNAGRHPWKALVMVLGLSLLVFRRSNFFYIIDDWTAPAFPLAHYYWRCWPGALKLYYHKGSGI